MKVNLNYGVVIRELRKRQGMSIQVFAREISKSAGWVSSVENCDGKCRVTDVDLARIVEHFSVAHLRPQFRTWIANERRLGSVDRRMEGPVLRHVRRKKGLTLKQVAARVGVSPSYLSKVENGKHPPTVELQKKSIWCL